MTTEVRPRRQSAHARVAIVGAGFAGLGLAISLKRQGSHDFVVFERGSDVGGTWRDNTYPGCQCDVPSHLYSFSFAPNPEWSRTYSMQPEIWDYLRDCSRRFGIHPHIRFGHALHRAAWDESRSCWRLETSRGSWTADVFVVATGALSEPSIPPLPGLDRFEGEVVHTGAWNGRRDLAGRKVAVIGTGASAIQVVPRIQPLVDRLYVFQRTPAWVLPHSDRPITRAERAVYRRFPTAQRLVRAGVYLSREALVPGLAKDRRLIEPVRWLAVRNLHRQVKDPVLRRKLTPRYSPGCKRLLLSNDFYPALTEGNVDLVTEPIAEIGPSSITTSDGSARTVDTIICATGFRVIGHPIAHAIHGRGEDSLAETWSESGMRAYLGTTVHGFPNLFFMSGPNTGIGHTSLLVMMEAQFGYVSECLRVMQQQGLATVDVTAAEVETFTREVDRKMRRSVWTTGGCASWYLDHTGRNPTLWPDFTWRYRRATRRFDLRDYRVTFRKADVSSSMAEVGA